MIAFLGMGLVDLLCWLIVLPALGILAFRSFLNSDDRRTLIIKWISSVILLLIIVWISSMENPFKPLWLIVPCFLLGVIWMSNLLNFMFKPLSNTFDGGSEAADLKPFYFLAEAKRRKGLYQEAVAETLKQLERFPGDVEGMMKLAALQAEDLRDLPAAKATLDQLLQQSGLPPKQAVAALQTLADWQMQLGRDPAAARESFQRIIQMFPNSAFSHNAEQRLAHLDGVTQTREFREHAVFKVPSGERDLGLRQTAPLPESVPDDPEALAAEYVRQLEKYPADTETREKLALLYAEQFARLDLAVGQLEQLVALPNESAKHIARWLGLLATLHIRYGNDMVAAEHALRRVIARFPKSADAGKALARLAALQGEWKAAATSASAKALGEYDKDLGLKSASPSPWKLKT